MENRGWRIDDGVRRYSLSSILYPLFSVLVLAIATGAYARNVDLSTVPPRDGVQLTIYNSEDITLVRETRTVTFKKGSNPLQFSWANTLIDPTSVQLKFLTQSKDLEIVDTTFPHDKPQMLYWEVKSDIDGEAKVEITYFTSGISWSADYVALANPAEENVKFEGFVRVTNASGEDYDSAQVRLVVGKINLVEKIAQLAQIPAARVHDLPQPVVAKLETEALQKEMADLKPMASFAMPATQAAKEKEVEKESLSEYFLYTVEGTETIKSGWSKRMRSIKEVTVPLKIQYRYRPAEYGDQLVRMYLLTNDKDSKLGSTPLPDGVYRIFRDNGHEGLSFLAAQTLKYVPIGDKVELNLGADPNVIFELIKLRSFRDEIWMRLNGVDVYRKIGGGVDIDLDATVAGWDEHALYTQRIRNYTAKPINLEIRRTFPGHVFFRSQLAPTLFDFQTVQLTTDVQPAATADLRYEVITRQGHNAKQNNVTLEKEEK